MLAAASGPGAATPPPGETPAPDASPAACRNCGATLGGRYCSDCAQPAHIHRSLAALAHDILHGVFHFEGRVWRTLPELFFHPGRLTRRYIDGERARFVSPMALFLCTVFLMFAVFSIVGGAGNRDGGGPPGATPLQKDGPVRIWSPMRDGTGEVPWIGTGWPAIDGKLNEGLRQLNENPRLLLYRLKTNSYKFSWALIPMSLPFMWLMFFWRRDVRLYDHAVFVTYSISFVMLLTIVLAIAAAVGVGTDLREAVMLVVPPVHLYRQLRGAYGVSRAGALVRLLLLLVSIGIVLATFTALLLLFGVLD
ncbi:DUF3667 domain-containing protein [Luteimonas sp. R10]|uniref:DUF3667 domain-containing protein n=1 Tax=Luteimonas sp. R10 TaxID=3108176 RepID=UPI003086AB40|nr:DUF3667 domain-containing protein [Luteimonas sp. R10]